MLLTASNNCPFKVLTELLHKIKLRWEVTALLNVNRLTPNDPYMGRTAPLTSKRCILYIYSTNIGTEYFNPLAPELFFL